MTQTLEQLSAAATKGELLPCPFCSGDAGIGESEDGPFVNCTDCLASTNVLVPQGQTRTEVIAAWSQRTGQLVAVSDDAIERVKAEARDKALDEAAEAMENLSFFTDVSELIGMTKQEMSERTCHEGAQAIRALKSPKPQEATMSEGVGG